MSSTEIETPVVAVKTPLTTDNIVVMIGKHFDQKEVTVDYQNCVVDESDFKLYFTTYFADYYPYRIGTNTAYDEAGNSIAIVYKNKIILRARISLEELDIVLIKLKEQVDLVTLKKEADKAKKLATVTRIVEEQIYTVQNDLSAAQESCTSTQKALINFINTRTRIAIQHKQLSDNKDKSIQALYDGIESIKKLAHVLDIQVTSANIEITTDMLYVNAYDHEFEIGEFLIKIPFFGISPTWHNKTRQVDAYSEGQMHPHVWKDGTACLGSATRVFTTLFEQQNYYAIAEYAIRFIQSVNVDDPAGEYIYKWPLRDGTYISVQKCGCCQNTSQNIIEVGDNTYCPSCLKEECVQGYVSNDKIDWMYEFITACDGTYYSTSYGEDVLIYKDDTYHFDDCNCFGNDNDE